MGIGDVVAQQSGSGSLEEAVEAMNQASETAEDAAKNAPQDVGTSITFDFGGERMTFTTQTLILYGIALADVLLIYIALRV